MPGLLQSRFFGCQAINRGSLGQRHRGREASRDAMGTLPRVSRRSERLLPQLFKVLCKGLECMQTGFTLAESFARGTYSAPHGRGRDAPFNQIARCDFAAKQ